MDIYIYIYTHRHTHTCACLCAAHVSFLYALHFHVASTLYVVYIQSYCFRGRGRYAVDLVEREQLSGRTPCLNGLLPTPPLC